MTILIGAIHENKIYIGADSLWTWSDEFVRESKTSKFINISIHGILIATSGQDKFTQILEKLLIVQPRLLDFKDRSGLIRLIDEFQKLVVKHGIGEAENNELPEHELGFMIATNKAKKIWIVECDYGISEFDDYVCTGSGAYLGESSMKTLSKLKINGKDAVQTAIETVCDLHPYCGGKIEIRNIELDPKVLE